LHQLWRNSLTTKQKEAIRAIRVTGSGRQTSQPPLVAPFNFGIDADWWADESQRFTALVGDWGKFEDPVGFGSRRLTEGQMPTTATGTPATELLTTEPLPNETLATEMLNWND
jgi:hypothetical protein